MAEKSLITLTDGKANVKVHYQKDTYWCYAAGLSVAAALLGGAWAPCQIVSRMVWKRHLDEAENEHLKKTCNCCLKESKRSALCKGANAAGKMAAAMGHINLVGTKADGLPAFADVRQDIDAGRPLVLTLQAVGAPAGHLILVVGYTYNSAAADNAAEQNLRIYDPSGQKTKYSDRTDRTGTFLVTMEEIAAGYHKSIITVADNYTGLRFGAGGMTAPPAWATWEED
jgi:hypothetical protein